MSESQGNGRIGAILVGAVLVLAGWWSLREKPSAVALSPEQRVLQDARVRRLLEDCGIGLAFDEDTSNLVPALVSKLEMGLNEPLKMATRELAQIGAPAVPELRRLFERARVTPFLQGVVKNVVEVCALMDDPAGLDVLRSSFDSIEEAIRLAAADGLARHKIPEDYDRVRGWVSAAVSLSAKRTYCSALRAMDEERFRGDLLVWLEQGQHADLYPYVADAALGAQGDAIARFQAAGAHYDVTPASRLYLIAPAAGAGEKVALEELLSTAQGEHPGRATVALDALARIGQIEALGEALVHDTRREVRLAALTAIRKLPNEEIQQDLLAPALADPDPGVAGRALEELLKLGHPLACARALTSLRGTSAEQELAMTALVQVFPGRPDVAEQAFQLLRGELASAQDRGRRITLIQLLARIPLAEVAPLLFEQLDFFQGPVKGLAPHRFLCGQIFNTGETGRAFLRARLPREPDPERRLDLIEMIWQDREPASLAVLLEAFEQAMTPGEDPVRPFELLYIADRLAVMGPARVVAPRIEWAYRESTHPMVRPALQCLLWQWFGDLRFMRE